MPAPARVVIESVRPQVDGGRYPVKRVTGEEVLVEADVFADGHDQVGVELLYKFESDRDWKSIAMAFRHNDHWAAAFAVEKLGRRTRPTALTMESALEAGAHTTLRFLTIDDDVTLDERLFTTSALERGE